MERALSEIEANIASLRQNAIAFRALAMRHRAADNIAIADKLLEVVGDLEKSAAEMQALLKRRAS
jgi:hypothetical protein